MTEIVIEVIATQSLLKDCLMYQQYIKIWILLEKYTDTIEAEWRVYGRFVILHTIPSSFG